MKKLILIILISLNSILLINAQQIGDGFSPVIANFGDILKSGVYNGINAPGGVPDNSYSGWQHLFVIRHPNANNNHQLQISSSFSGNDRLFFRKIAAMDLNPISPIWIELATRGSNNFIGSQSISGSISLGDDSNNSYSKLVIKGPNYPTNENSKRDISFEFAGAGKAQIRSFRGGFWDTNIQFLTSSYGNIGGEPSVRLHINGDGNIGIGTVSPVYKLDVCGTIRAKEVKVDLGAGCDFVFKSDYKLMDLKTLEQFVKTNQHLPEIAAEKEMVENGVNMKELQMKLLQKMEEMTLYVIELKKENEELILNSIDQNKRLNEQERMIESIRKETNFENSK